MRPANPFCFSYLNRLNSLLTMLLIGVTITSHGVLCAETSAHAAPPAANSVESYGRLPLAFEANRGQADAQVQFLARGAGYGLYLTHSGATLALGQTGACKPNPSRDRSTSNACIAQQDVVRLTLDGASTGTAAKAIGEAELPGKVNYFLGSDPTRWKTGLPTYAKVRYSAIYPGIDLLYYGNGSQLEYDFVLAPGANPANIRLRFEGEKQLAIAPNGDLVLKGAYGSAKFLKPVVYQEIDGRRQPVAGSFKLSVSHTVGFTLGSYNHAKPLVIDPVLAYSTYLGGSRSNGNGDQGNGIAVSSVQHAYIVGTTFSANFPIVAGAVQPTDNAASGTSTVFVTELSLTGNGLVYSTYLGGSGGDYGYGIALDTAGNAYITGATYSKDFPVVCGAFEAANNSTTTGAPTAFVTKLNATGSGLLYSTYLGGSGNHATPAEGDVAQAIAVNASGNAYVTGYTYSSDFPVSDAAYQTTFKGSATASNAFITELDAGGVKPVYSTYLSGSGSSGHGDVANAIALDSSGDAFVTGGTYSPDFPVTKGAYQTTLASGAQNAFVTELNPSGTDTVYSTYLGGNSQDSAQAIAVDSSGFAYVAGTTFSMDFPLTDGVVEGASVGLQAYFGPFAFVTKLNQDGSALVYSTDLEGNGTTVNGLAVDSAGNAYLAGSAPVPAANTYGSFQSTPDALAVPATTGNAAFLVKLNPSASVFNYATLLGGSANDQAMALALDAAGNVYLTGAATSTNFPTNNSAYQRTNKAAPASNAFVSKFSLASETNQTTYPTLPSNVPTSMTLVSQSFQWIDDGQCDEFTITVNVNLVTGIGGPPPTGTINFYGAWEDSYPYGVGGSWGGSTVVNLFGAGLTVGGPVNGWQASYSGDSVYQASNISGNANIPSCTPEPFVRRGTTANNKLGLSALRTQALSQTAPAPASPSSIVLGPKFTPAPATLRETPQTESIRTESIQSQATPGCIAPIAHLTVTVTPSLEGKTYGQPNPGFSYKITGLLDGDSVTVTLQTTATQSSPVGTYPVTATVTGASAANYAVTVIPATLKIFPAILYISASNLPITYGQTPPQPTVYKLTGFVNGDTTSVVSGTPLLSTSVTSTTPVGFYPIRVQVGTLTAANYTFSTTSNGEGSVGVYKAPLKLSANSMNLVEGQTPALTYSLTGFVNGQSASGTVTGVPTLTTTATANSLPGKYPIVITQGSLSAQNYFFEDSNGVLTVIP
jgi:hypothetical protein